MSKKQIDEFSIRLKEMKMFANENNLKLYYLKELDLCLFDHIKEDDLYKKVLLSIKDYKSDIFPDYMKDTSDKTHLVRGLYSISDIGIICALIMSLFLRSNNEKLKLKIKGHILSNTTPFLGDSLDENTIINLVKEYQKSILNKLHIEKENLEYLRQINDYYAISEEELLDQIQKTGMKFGI